MNELSVEAAVELFDSCSGSREWAEQMAEGRPFAMLDHLFDRAEKTWHSAASRDLVIGGDKAFEVVKIRLGRMLER